MDDDTVGDSTNPIDDISGREPETKSDNVYVHDGISSNEGQIRELGSAGEILTRVDLDLACCSEKLVNLDILLMHVVAKENDDEVLTIENDNVSADFFEKAMEFDLLSGILDSEVTELHNFIATLQTEIVDARQRISSCGNMGETFIEMEEKLRDSEESLKQFQDLVLDMKMQSSKIQRSLLAVNGHESWYKLADFSENSEFLNMNTKLKMHTAEQQRHILRMLEKSLARELDIEKKLSDSRQCEEELNLKLHASEQELFDMEEAAEQIWGRLFEAENAAEVLKGISKELMGQLQVVQFNLSSSINRESDMKSKLEESTERLKAKESALQKLESSSAELQSFLLAQTTSLKASLKEAEDKYIIANSEAFTLREKVNLLEDQLRESDSQMQNSKASIGPSQDQHNIYYSELSEMGNAIEVLKETVSKAESRAESAEAKCTLLAETNLELNEELGFLRGSGNIMEKVNLLEKQLRESDIQLQHAKASAEASQEQQNMLYSAIGDMENLINDLKSKVSKAESRVDIAEEKCILLTETNVELNEELNFLRDKMECLERSLHQVDGEKAAMAKDINKTTKIIADLLMQLSMERERLQTQICSLTKENKILAENVCKSKNDASVIFSHTRKGDDQESLHQKPDFSSATCTKASEEAVTESLVSGSQVDKSSEEAPICETEVGDALLTSNLETVRTIDAWQLKLKYVFMAILISLISILAAYLLQNESGQF